VLRIQEVWANDNSFGRKDWIKFMRSYIRVVISHFKDSVTDWDVVNEALDWPFDDSQPAFLRDTIWLQKIGPRYIEIAYRTAKRVGTRFSDDFRTAWNDFAIDNINPKSNLAFDIIQDLNSRHPGTVTTMGFQAHFGGPPAPFSLIRDNYKRFKELNLSLIQTELDIWHKDPIEPGFYDEQAFIYKQLVLLSIRFGFDAIITWGMTDAQSWVPQFFATDPNLSGRDYPLLYDENFLPKPAFYSFVEAFTQTDFVFGHNFPKKQSGVLTSVGWTLAKGGKLLTWIRPSVCGDYKLRIEAAGTPEDFVFPMMAVQFGDGDAEMFSVDSTDLMGYDVDVGYLHGNAQKLTVTFLDEPANSKFNMALYIRKAELLLSLECRSDTCPAH